MGILETVSAVIAGIVTLVYVVSRALRKRDKKTRADAEEKARRLDHENAASIRNRTRDARSVRIKRDDDTRGYRD